MKRLTIQEYAYPGLTAYGIGEKNTVSNGPDDGTLNCNVGHFWNCMRHGSTQQALDNGLSAVMMKISPEPPGQLTVEGVLSAGALNLCGHGNEGLVETGMGQTGPFDANKIVYNYNEYAWGPQFDRIQPTSIPLVSVWACHPGAGQDGADLLYAMAKHCGRAVRGGTGFLYCNAQNLWWENGSVWQAATPSSKPAPIAAPSPHSFTVENVRFESGGRESESTEVEEIHIALESFGTHLGPNKALRGVVAQYAVAHLFRSLPMDMNVGIAAMITGNIRVSFSKGESAEFVIYNDKLAVDRASRTGYYISSLQSLYHTLS